VPNPGPPPAGTTPTPAPVESSTTRQTISQVQISGCTSHCQNVSQVQVAVQESLTVQVAGTAVQSATALETQPSPNSSSKVTSSVTQIQIGCVSECFGTTTTDPSTATLTQQFLSDVTSVQPACGSSTPQPTPGPTQATVESVVNQVACQVQAAQAIAMQTEVASQSATTVQVTDDATVSQPPAPQSVAEAQQGTWQLQIGCVFYCVDTQQVQLAQQSITIIEVQTGTTGSNPGAVDVTDQIIWQVQVGCVAWCYDATQTQVVAGQSTVIVDESPAPASSPPPPPPPTPPAPGPAPGPSAPAQQAGPADGQPTATRLPSQSAQGPPEPVGLPTRRVRMSSTAAFAGATVSGLIAPVAPAAPAREATLAVASARISSTPTVPVHPSIESVVKSSPRRSRQAAARRRVDPPMRVAAEGADGPRVSSEPAAIALLLVAAAVLVALTAMWTQTDGRSER
jgi:hypothetical protein